MLDRAAPDQADPLDRARSAVETIARRLRLARQAAGITQEAMGELLGLTFQQVQKYEKGTNRISAGRLSLVAEITGKDVAWFYDAPAVDHQVADYVLLIDGLFVTDDGVSPYVDEAQRFTRAAARSRAKLYADGVTAASASDFADDRFRSRASLLAELAQFRAGQGA